jgi:hypothetical protein
MQRPASLPQSASLFAVSTLCAAVLAACGGGGSDAASSSSAASIDDATATTYAANATQIGSDTMDVADSAVLGAQALIAAGVGVSSSDDRATAMGVDAQPLVASTRTCPGGGSATVSITGGTPETQVNGKLDTGEIYQVRFAACAGAARFATLDGTLAMTVESVAGDSANGALSLSLTATNLSLTLPHGVAMLNGSTERQYSVSTDTDGTVHLSSHFTSPSLTLATHYNARASSFTLSNADIVRTATLVDGVLQSSTISSSHTLSATLPNASFSYTVATIGGATYAADGTPTGGQWTITLPQTIVGVTISGGMATITIDRGKDGTIDRTITVPVPQLVSTAG